MSDDELWEQYIKAKTLDYIRFGYGENVMSDSEFSEWIEHYKTAENPLSWDDFKRKRRAEAQERMAAKEKANQPTWWDLHKDTIQMVVLLVIIVGVLATVFGSWLYCRVNFGHLPIIEIPSWCVPYFGGK